MDASQNERDDRLERLFEAAAAYPPEERAAFLDEACGGDEVLRTELESLLSAAGDAISFIDEVAGPALFDLAGAMAGETPAADEHADPLIGQYVAHFEIIERLGSGGMGIVYKARDTKLGRLVALKLLPHHLSADREARARLVSEAKAASALDHPNLATIFETGEHRGQLFIAMAFYEGETLKARLANGPLSARLATEYVVQLTQGLQRAHEEGIVHRDVKPANILVTRRGLVKLVDFGIAQVHGDGRTGKGLAFGTSDYMSPEQARGQEVDARSDLWSLGVVYYEMLSGELPFPAIDALLDRRARPKSLSSLRPELPEGPWPILEKMLRKDPAERYQTAEEVLADLLALKESSPTGTRGRARWSPGRQWWTISAPLVVLAGLIGALLWPELPEPRPEDASSNVKSASAGADYASQTEISLAVLPLKNFSNIDTEDFFAEGMTEELITTLTKIEALRVIAHQSVRQFQDSSLPVSEIARLLDVEYVLDGSILQQDDRLRINTTLINAETNTPVWGERFERPRSDIVALQREVALAIAQAVSVTLTPQDEVRLANARMVDPDAFDFYIQATQARYDGTRSAEAAGLFEKAVAIDSTYAPAYAGLAFLLAFLHEDGERARQLAERAVDLDPKLADSYVALGLIRQIHDWDWSGAEGALRQAIMLNPGHAEAHHELSMLLMRLGRFDEALHEAQHTLYLAPTSARFQHGLGEVYFFSRQYEAALVAAEKARSLDERWAGVYLLEGAASAELGQFERSMEAFQKAIALGCDCQSMLGHTYAISGMREQALAVLDVVKARGELEGKVGTNSPYAYDMASIHAGLGDENAALQALEHSVRQDVRILYLGIDPIFHPLHDEPRFQALLVKMGLGENGYGHANNPGVPHRG